MPSRNDAFGYRRDRSEMMNGRSEKLYGEFAAEFFGQVKSAKKPFFLMVNAHDPHRPFDNRKPAKERNFEPKAKQEAPAANVKKKRRPRGDYPAPSRIYQPDEIVIPGFLPDLPPIREEIAQYYSSVRRADDVVGRVLMELEKAGFADNTLVMLKSDHGIPVPFAKTNVWRHSTLTPWLVRWPGVVKPGTHETEHLVAGVDFAPTILDALGLPPMKGMDGRSFLPVLKERSKRDVSMCTPTSIRLLPDVPTPCVPCRGSVMALSGMAGAMGRPLSVMNRCRVLPGRRWPRLLSRTPSWPHAPSTTCIDPLSNSMTTKRIQMP